MELDLRLSSFDKLYPKDYDWFFNTIVASGKLQYGEADGEDGTMTPWDGYKQSMKHKYIATMLAVFMPGCPVVDDMDGVTAFGGYQDTQVNANGENLFSIVLGDNRGDEGIFFAVYHLVMDPNEGPTGFSEHTPAMLYHLRHDPDDSTQITDLL